MSIPMEIFQVFPTNHAHHELIRECNRLVERIRRDVELIQANCDRQKEIIEQQRQFLAATAAYPGPRIKRPVSSPAQVVI